MPKLPKGTEQNGNTKTKEVSFLKNNDIAIVTGASKGIGREIAKNLAKKGVIVVANYNKSEKEAIKLKKELENEGFLIDIFKADVSKKEECEKLVKYTENKYKKIDILINNAGIDKYQLIDEVKEEDWNEIINTNLYSAFCMCQGVIKNMIHNKKGCIINISSIWGKVGAAQEILYSISKAGLDGLTKALAKEVGPSNIRVNSIAPGIIDTEMNKNLIKEEIDKIKEEIPLEKIGRPEDIAKCIMWLIEDNYTTGQIISIDGGWVIT